MLIDSIKTCNYFAPEDEENIVQKLTDLQPKTFKFSDKYQHTVNYRMDRITEVEEVILENKDIQDKIDPAQYRLRHPIIFSGSIERVRVLCRDTGKNYIMKVNMDYFGKPAKVITAQGSTAWEADRRFRSFL